MQNDGVNGFSKRAMARLQRSGVVGAVIAMVNDSCIDGVSLDRDCPDCKQRNGRPDCAQCVDPRPARWEGRLRLGGELVPLCDGHAEAESIGPIARLS